VLGSKADLPAGHLPRLQLAQRAAGSWTGRPLSYIPRLGGQFLQAQADAAIAAGAPAIYVAIFAEMDEATAIFKLAPDQPTVPAHLFLKPDPPAADHYLRLSKDIAVQHRRDHGGDRASARATLNRAMPFCLGWQGFCSYLGFPIAVESDVRVAVAAVE
jgi:hypothetical protein